MYKQVIYSFIIYVNDMHGIRHKHKATAIQALLHTVTQNKVSSEARVTHFAITAQYFYHSTVRTMSNVANKWTLLYCFFNFFFVSKNLQLRPPQWPAHPNISPLKLWFTTFARRTRTKTALTSLSILKVACCQTYA